MEAGDDIVSKEVWKKRSEEWTSDNRNNEKTNEQTRELGEYVRVRTNESMNLNN